MFRQSRDGSVIRCDMEILIHLSIHLFINSRGVYFLKIPMLDLQCRGACL